MLICKALMCLVRGALPLDLPVSENFSHIKQRKCHPQPQPSCQIYLQQANGVFLKIS